MHYPALLTHSFPPPSRPPAFEIYAQFFVQFYFFSGAFNIVLSLFTSGWLAEKCCHKEEGCWANFVQLCVGEYLQMFFGLMAIAGTIACFIMVLTLAIFW